MSLVPVGLCLLSLPPTSHFSFILLSLTTGRAQRASARQQNGNSAVLEPAAQLEVLAQSKSTYPESEVDMVVDDEPSLSRSNSSLNLQEPNIMGRGKRKDKGKGKEVESAPVKVKEEPRTVSLVSPEPPGNMVSASCSIFWSLEA